MLNRLKRLSPGWSSSWEGRLWDCVRGNPRQGRAEGRHQARRQSQDQGVGQGKRPREGGGEVGGGGVVYNLIGVVDQEHLQGQSIGKQSAKVGKL